MGSEYKDSASDPNRQQYIPRRPRFYEGDETQLRAGLSASSADEQPFEEFSYREHATSPLEAQQSQPRAQGMSQTPAYYPPTPLSNGQRAANGGISYVQPAGQQPNYAAQQYQPAQQGMVAYPPANYAFQNGYNPQTQQAQQGQQGNTVGYAPAPYYPQYPQANQPPYVPGPQMWPRNGYAPNAQPAAGGYANNGYYYPGYYYPPYYYPTYGYANFYAQPPRPRRDGYLFTMAIISTICSSIVLITGFLCTLVLILVALSAGLGTSSSQPDALFGGIVLFTSLALAGLVGGSFGLFHSINSLLKRRSREFKLPRSGIFLGLYIILLIIGFIVRGSAQVIANIPLSIFLIALAGLLPVLTILAFTVRRLHYPKEARWPTTWRRFAIALISGATSAILIALILEEVLGLIVQLGLNLTSFNLNDTTNIPTDPRAILYLFLVASVIAPIVEETAKPLAVVALIGRMNSAAEAFFLGMACGVGFDLIETTGYISEGYRNWVDVAVERSTAGLLHGFGAGMTALGWYFLTHRNSLKNRRVLIGIGCIIYAMLQHAIWNASSLVVLLPAPIGPFFNNGQIMIGSYPLQSILLVYLVISVLILVFLIFVTGKLSGRSARSSRRQTPLDGRKEQSVLVSGPAMQGAGSQTNGSAVESRSNGQPAAPQATAAPSEVPRGQ